MCSAVVFDSNHSRLVHEKAASNKCVGVSKQGVMTNLLHKMAELYNNPATTHQPSNDAVELTNHLLTNDCRLAHARV